MKIVDPEYMIDSANCGDESENDVILSTCKPLKL